GREVGDRIVTERGIKIAIGRMRERGEVDGVAVGVGARDEFGGDVAARPALVLDHDLLAPNLRQPGGDDAGSRVDSPARRERADDAHHLAGPSLRMRGEGARGGGAAEKRYEVAPSQLMTQHQLPRGRRTADGKSYETKTRACLCEVESMQAANSVYSLPPCGGELGRGVMRRDNDGATCKRIALPPPPAPPHKGEGSAPSADRPGFCARTGEISCPNG